MIKIGGSHGLDPTEPVEDVHGNPGRQEIRTDKTLSLPIAAAKLPILIPQEHRRRILLSKKDGQGAGRLFCHNNE